MDAPKYDYLFKVLMIGNSAVGKSSLLVRFAEDWFSEGYFSTIGVDFRIKTLNINGTLVKLQIWDTAGQERFRTVTSTYYRGAHGVLVVYDVNDADSFADIKDWLAEIHRNTDVKDVILVGNKNDQPERKKVLSKDAQRVADMLNMPFIETSAKENINVNEMFTMIAQMALNTARNAEVTADTKPVAKGMKLSKMKSSGKSLKKCCN